MSIATIVALATPAGVGGVAIVRVSGPLVPSIALAIVDVLPSPRLATLASFKDVDGEVLDHGVILYFPAPHSFTGEDVLELHAHGSPIVVDLLQEHIISLGARYARPGEFSERAFLNGKLDLTQAEAIADLINASTAQAARAALRSLQGGFARQINMAIEHLTQLRVHVEAAIDFVDEDLDIVTVPALAKQLLAIQRQLTALLGKARQGALLNYGLSIAIVGPPNAGKSTLLNVLTGQDLAIVTDIPGTTRDLIKGKAMLAGLPINFIDTAGLRSTNDVVEQEGIKRAQQAMISADLILFMFDVNDAPDQHVLHDLIGHPRVPVIMVRNKIDLIAEPAAISSSGDYLTVSIAAETEQGIDLLHEAITTALGIEHNDLNECYLARQRHLDSLEQAQAMLAVANTYVHGASGSWELLAEELRQAQLVLGSITGAVSTEELLSRIFASFCIGK